MKRLSLWGVSALAMLTVAALPAIGSAPQREALPSIQQAARGGELTVEEKWCKACMDLECYVYVSYPCTSAAAAGQAEQLVDASGTEATRPICG